MRKRKPPLYLPPWLDALLRWWWRIYLGVLVVAFAFGIGSAIAQQGPQGAAHYLDQYPYLLYIEQTLPLAFWSGLGALTLLAVAGLALNIADVLWARAEEDRLRQTYLRAIDAVYQVIPLVIEPDLVEQLPEIVYQRLTYQSDPTRPPDESSATTAGPSGLEAEDILQVLDAGRTRCAVILGRPGGGKTILLRHSMSRIARQARDDRAAYFPVYLSLPRLAPLLLSETRASAPPASPVVTYLLQHERALDGMPGAATRETFAQQLADKVEHGEAFLLLDGLDEVDPGYRRRVIEWIRERQLAVNLRGALVVSTRFTDYTRGDFIRVPAIEEGRAYTGFTEWVAQAMDPETRLLLATNLLPALEEQLAKIARQTGESLRREGQNADPARFVALIERHPQHALWEGNPLLFSLAAYVYVRHLAQGSDDLPPSRVALYGQVMTALLAKIVRSRHETDAPGAVEVGIMREMLRMLAEFALWLTRNGPLIGDEVRPPLSAEPPRTAPQRAESQSFTYEILVAGLEQVRDILRVTYTPQQMATWVRNSGTLEVEAKHAFQFRHHTYQEYLTALALAQRLAGTNDDARADAWQVAREQRFVPTWAEPMRMLAGALLVESKQGWPQGRQVAREWFDELRALATSSGGASAASPAADQALAYAALELAVASLPEIPNLDSFAQEISARDWLRGWADALLRAALDKRSDTLQALQRLAPGVAVLPKDVVQAALDRFYAALADETQPELQVAAAEALEGMGDLVEDIAPLTRVLFQGHDPTARAAAARALAKLERGVQNHPGHSALRQALEGSDADLAQTVAGALVEAGEVAYPLMRVAVASRDVEVRRLGVLALGGVGPRAQPDLRRLLEDPELAVSATAVEMLNRLGEDASTLLPILATMARQGADAVLIDRVFEGLLSPALRQLGFAGQVRGGTPVIVPPLCAVPAGGFLMGSDPKRDREADSDEQPQREVMVAAFQIARYPVTVAEYGCYLRANGKVAASDKLDHPVVNVSWNDAVAYAAWLAQLTGQPWRLPTEAEWEKAARGTDGRIYPWGDQWDRTRANTDDGGPGTTTPVGAYADRGDASPYGAHDLAGNVFEWTSSVFKPYPYRADDGRERANSTDNRVLRGGSWYDNPRYARAARRLPARRLLSLDFSGFRVVCAVPSS